MAIVNLTKRTIGNGYAYSETIASGVNGNTIIIPPKENKEDNITCRIIAGAGTGKFQFTTSKDSAVLAGTETWTDWPKGAVTGTDYDIVNGPITGLRGVSTSGEIVIEVVR